jgi:hypothetical protein
VDYLEALGDDVDAGLTLIVHDLVVTRALTKADATALVRSRADDHLSSLGEHEVPDAAETACWVAETVQDDLLDGLRVTWPPCPDHPQHPLWLQPRNPANTTYVDRMTDPVWTCITSHRPIAELGGL